MTYIVAQERNQRAPRGEKTQTHSYTAFLHAALVATLSTLLFKARSSYGARLLLLRKEREGY